jgi:CheY-like chemotaxis protein
MVRFGDVTRRHIPSVLVVDDYPSVREWMTRRLRLGDIDVVAASTGEEALDLAVRYRPDLAFIDFRLPQMSGVEAAVAIQKAGVSLPWILFSASQSDQAAFSAGQHGALRVVWTPFDVYGVAREALNALEHGRVTDWLRLRHAGSLSQPGTTMGCAAWWILKACESADDLPRIGAWVKFVGVSYSPLRAAFKRIGVEPHDARDFMRVLRALAIPTAIPATWRDSSHLAMSAPLAP